MEVYKMDEFIVSTPTGYILVCRNTEEAYNFDTFGKYLGNVNYKEALSKCVNPQRVCLLSICGKMPFIDIYVGGMRGLYVGKSVSEFINNVRKSASDLLHCVYPFRMLNEENIPHVVLVMKKDTTYLDICNRLNLTQKESWVPVAKNV